MAILDLKPREERNGVDFTINADFSGSDGDTNRTYALTYSNFLAASGIEIVIQGLDATQGVGKDFTVATASGVTTITFLNNIDDDMNIIIRYFTGTTLAAPGSGAYATGDDVKAILQTPSFTANTTPTETDVNLYLEMAADQIDQQTQHAWREITIADEFYDFPYRSHAGIVWGRPGWTGIPIHLRHRNIRTFSSGDGDKLEIWDGSSYIDWISTKTEGRADDFWIDQELGILYIRFYYPYFREKAIKITYRYGESSVPSDIRRACAYMASVMVLENDDRSELLNDTGSPDNAPYDIRISNMQKRVDKILHNRTELPIISTR